MTPEIIVHCAIEHLAIKPMACCLPDFPYQEAVFLYSLHFISKSNPEGIADFTCHIQAPSIDIIVLSPIATYIREVLLHFFIVCGQFRHHSLIPKAFILGYLFPSIRNDHRVLQMVEPRPILGFFSFLFYILKGKEVPATMIEYAVDYYTHVPIMYLINEALELLIRTEDRINMVVINKVILMVLTCNKDRVQINSVASKFFYIVEILPYSFYGPTLKALAFFSFVIIEGRDRGDIAFLCCKAIWENVVDNCILCPVRDIDSISSMVIRKLEVIAS